VYVSHKLRIIYMAVPRTASRAVRKFLVEEHRAREVGKKGFGGHHGIDGKVIRQCYDLGYKIICPVRNPWDVIVSWWHHNPRWFGEANAEFAKFVEWFPKHGKNKYLFEGMLYHFWAQHSTRIIKYEHLRADLARIIRAPVNLEVIGKSDRKPYADYYDDELREYVAEAFAAEIEEYGYSF
jgi:hypothetical protein